MKVLEKLQLFEILAKFNFDDKVNYQKCFEFEPDCFLYIFTSENHKNYALVCRDLVQDDLEAEKRIFKDEIGIDVMENFTLKTDNNDYWLEIPNIETYAYYFSLISFSGNITPNPNYFPRANSAGRE